jgi:pyruvate/2-oxoglutarate/acetoin dehydrogenase E1 component
VSQTVTFREAIRETIFARLAADDELITLGENFHYTGSTFSQVMRPEFVETFGPDRVIETPVSENGIMGTAFGAALVGMPVIAEIYSSDFAYTVGNEILNDLSRWRYKHRFEDPINLVVRAPVGVHPEGGGGPEHSQCPESIFHGNPGLTIVVPGTIPDAVGLLQSSLESGNPTLFFEHRRLYDTEGEFDTDRVLDVDVPVGEASVVTEGDDVTVVAWGHMRQRAEDAVASLPDVSVELIDPRTIKPMDAETIEHSVAKTGALLVVEESFRTGSVGGEIVARMVENGHDLDATRLTLPDVPHPYPPSLEAELLPSVDEIAAAIDDLA